MDHRADMVRGAGQDHQGVGPPPQHLRHDSQQRRCLAPVNRRCLEPEISVPSARSAALSVLFEPPA